MGKKFDQIFEAVVSRSEIGGYLPGDIIKFRDGYKNTETYKFMPSTLKKEVDELATCGLNIKVCQVGDKQSGYSIGNQFKPASQIVLTIAADHGGGRTYGRVVVCPDMVDMVDVSAGVPVPDQFKRKNTVIIKPKQLKIDPNIITNVTDKGNGKNTPTDLKLAGESTRFTRDNNTLGMLYESIYVEGVDDAEKYRLITAFRYAQKTGNPSALKIATTNLQTWANQTQGAYQDPEVLEFIDPPQAPAPAQGAASQQAQAPPQQPQTNPGAVQPQTQAPQQAPAQAQAPTQPQGKQYPAYVRFKYNTNTIDRVFTREELNKKIAAGNAKEDEYNPVNERGEIMQDDGGVYDMLKFNSLNHDANLMKKLRGLNIPIKGDSYTQSQAQPAQPAQAPPTQPVVGESKSWDFTKELGNIYDEILQEKFDFKKADRNKNGKLEDWEKNIGEKIFGDDEDGDEEEDNEECGEEEEQDACYKKVKSRYKVWPSAYASGALVKCRKVGAKNWGNSKK